MKVSDASHDSSPPRRRAGSGRAKRIYKGGFAAPDAARRRHGGIARGYTRSLLFFLLLLTFSLPAHAVEPNEMLKDPALEARARDISQELRCLVCQGQSIDDSDADLAKDLRLLVRQRIKAGDTDAQVRQYLKSRYGDYILLNPPVEQKTLLLWLTPALMLLAGLGVAVKFIRKNKS